MTDPGKTKKILSAVDLGPQTGNVLAYALWLAGADSKTESVASEVCVLHVMDYALTPPAYLLPYIEEEEAMAEKKLEGLVNKIKSYSVTAGFKIAVGRLMESFNAAIKETGAGMIVLGHKSHLIRPSSSERLIKSLDIPMLVVRGLKSEKAEPGSLNVKKIVCAVDFSDNSLKAFRFAQSLSDLHSAELICVHIASNLRLEKNFQEWTSVCEDDKCKYRDEMIHQGKEQFDSFLPKSGMIEKVVRTGIPYELINSIASDKDADLIIMGARGLSYMEGVLLGSVSEAIIKSSPCPVMIVR